MSSPVSPPLETQSKLKHTGSSSVTSCANPYDMKHESFSGRMFKVTAAYLAGHPSLSGLVKPGEKLCGLCRRAAAERDSGVVRRHRRRVQESDLQKHVETSRDSADAGLEGEMAADSRDVTMTTVNAALPAAPKEMQQPEAGPGSTVGDQDAGTSGFSNAALLVKTELEVKQELPDSEDSDESMENMGSRMGATVLVKSEVDLPEDQGLGEETSEEPTSEATLASPLGEAGSTASATEPAAPRSSGEGDLFRCPHCPRAFRTSDLLRRHQLRYVNRDCLLECDICNLRCLTAARMQIHRARHSMEKSFSCETCGASFATRNSFVYHMKGHGDVDKPCICHICDHACADTSALEKHIATHTHGKPTNVKCMCCGRSFRNRQVLSKHRAVCNGNKVTRYTCELCGSVYVNRRNFDSHVASHTDPCTHKCDHCDATFPSSYRLQSHTSRSHKEKTCQCGKILSSRAMLNRHRVSCPVAGGSAYSDNFDISLV